MNALANDGRDTVLAGHYGLTAAELDFIPSEDSGQALNYDIRLCWATARQVKYRLGRAAGEEAG